MKNTTIDANLCKATITAGIAIVILTVAAVISNDLTIVKLFVTDDARETWENIIASKMLFRIGVFSWLVGFKIGISVKNSRYLTHFCIFWIYHHKWFQPVFPKYENVMVYVGMIFFIPMISEVAPGIWLLFIGIKWKPFEGV